MIEYIKSNILVLLAILIIMLSFKRGKKFLMDLFKIFREFLIKELQILFKNIIEYLSKVESNLYKGHPTLNELLLEDLTANLPVNKKDNQIKTYIDALSFAINNENVTNIALTGGYGTGKSTIINQFCKSNRGNEYLHISLASFRDDKSDEKLIETSIVQQILYYEKKLKIKESSYKRIHFTKPIYKISFIFLLVIWLYSVIFLFFENINSKIVFFNKEWIDIQYVSLVFILGVIYILYQSFEKFKNIKFSKLTPNSLELVNEKTDKELSVFNRNIDEIIYFFEKTNTNIVIVEDIDRFNDDIAIKLYSKIRELSILIKQSKDVNQQVKFIYSVKDELILEDKTKFFDIIIPVIPITDYSNSKNMFLLKLDSFFEMEEVENLVERESKSYLDKNFISEVSNYVYDMRTVINICNEFKLYNRVLTDDKPDINLNKLFAIVFYKNLFPNDFSKIQKQTSKLHKIFSKNFKDDETLKNIISKIDEEIAKKKDVRNQLKEAFDKQIIKDVNELRSIYIFTLIGMIYEKHGQKIEEIEKLNINYDLITDENFQKIKESQDIKYSYRYYDDNNSGISFEKLESRVNKELTYDEQEKHIKNFHDSRIAILEREIISLDNEKKRIQNLSLFELYQSHEENIDQFLNSIFTSIEIKIEEGKETIINEINPNISLFKYLLKNDYLNEDFIEYVSYFYPGSLSSNDHRLMMKINQNESTSFDEKIDNIENLVKSIRDIRFKNRSILIYDIFKFLLQNSHNINFKNNKFDFFLDQIQNFEDDSLYFIEGFIKNIINDRYVLSNFYDEMIKWNHFWNIVDVHFSEDLKRKVLFDLVQIFSHDEIDNRILVELNNDNRLTYYINSDENFLRDIFEKVRIKSIIEILIVLDVKFERINSDEKIKDLLLEIYGNNLYHINVDNLKLFAQIDSLYNFTEGQFYNSNFGFLKSNIQTKLYKRISANFSQYLNYVYLKIEENINESPEEVLYLLEQKDEKIDVENKFKIIQKGFNGKLESFGDIIIKDIQTLLLEKNKIFASWKNVLEYYSWESLFDSSLNNYLNDNINYSSLSILELLNEQNNLFDENDSCTDFIYALINNEEISQESFEAIFVESGDLVLKSNKINIDFRISYLEEKDFFILDQHEIDSFLKNNKNVLVKLIEKNEQAFISRIDAYSFEIEFVEDLLSSKLSIESLNEIIIEKENEIIENENLEFLQKISIFFIKNKSSNFTAKMFEKLITSDLEEKYKIGLFNLVASKEDNEYNISDLLKQMGTKFIDIINREKVSFEINDENQNFLTLLEKNNLILNFIKNRSEQVFNVFYNIKI